MSSRQSLFRKGAARLGWGLILALAVGTGCKKPADEKTPPTLASGPDDLFEDVTQAAGLDFVHQLIGGKIDNIMKSDGAGGTFLDFDGDGLMDIYLVNSGPAPVLAEAPPGTPRWPAA